MDNVENLINALKNGDNVAASDLFADTMSDKINDAMDDRRINIAQTMFADEEQMDLDLGSEEELEAETWSEDDVEAAAEESFEDEDIQGISDETAE